ncbi:MAG: hypothetical protein ACNA8W_11415, partial [Bradymonadaceae bacterium]
MNRRLALFAMVPFILMLTGCECDAESDAALCESSGAACGSILVRDRCDERREVVCGECGPRSTCEENLCLCIGDEEDDLCRAQAMECGAALVVDGCGEERSLDCGECADGTSCRNHSCVCDGETEAELCAASGWECGQGNVVDGCGQMRQVDCGACAPGDSCEEGICVCNPESEEDLCAAGGWRCGPSTIVDGCGDERDVECAPCEEITVTAGAITDAATGGLVEDAILTLHRWPPSGASASTWVWPSGFRVNEPDHVVRTADAMGERNYMFGEKINACLVGQGEEDVVSQSWYRARIDRPDYLPRIA